MAENRIDHDRLFKELLETFFAEFMELFFPEAAKAIDLSQVRFGPQEIFTDLLAGEKHVVDLLVETRLKGEPGMVLVHVEPQAYVQQNFAERMFIYFSRLYEKYRCRILPVAVFSYDQVREESDTLELGFSFLDVLRFKFYKLELKKLNWREFINSDNPVAAALLSKMGYTAQERVQVRVEFLRMLTRMQLDPARAELVAAFFETYLRLNEEEEKEFEREIRNLSPQEVETIMELTTSWHEKGKQDGTRAAILEFLKSRFGGYPVETASTLENVTDLERLRGVLREVYRADTLEAAVAAIALATNGNGGRDQ